MKSTTIQPIDRPIEATIRPPGSKSLTNRALVCAALAKGESTLTGILDSDDTRLMATALKELGIHVVADWNAATIVVSGCGGAIPAVKADLFVGNSGTTMRFLTAVVALGQGRFRLDGVPRMRERPIQDLLEALGALGVKARSETGNGCPPVIVDAAGLVGGQGTIRGDVSSQFLSALLMVAPLASQPVTIDIAGELVSQPYARMTLAVMKAYGVDLAPGDLQTFRFEPSAYRGRSYPIEPDASAASYLWASAAITSGKVTVPGLDSSSLQGDVAFVDCLKRMGCQVMEQGGATTVVGGPLVGIDVDMNGISDTAQTLAAVALFAKGPTTIRGVAHIRHKETDRIAAIATEIRKLGAQVDERQDGLKITPGPLHGATIDTYDDHRMAMSLALVGLKTPGVTINDPGCVSKTYPRFFDDLAKLAESRQ